MLWWYIVSVQRTRRIRSVMVRITDWIDAYAGCSCYTEAVLPPLLEHTSPSEAHFYPLTHARPLLLHTHTGAPFTSHPHTHGLNLTLHASPECKVASLHLRVDWWGSLGRAGARYWTAVPGWAVGIVVWLLFSALGEYERGGMTSAKKNSR
jgi:glycosylphosphatidylinositol deacylase